MIIVLDASAGIEIALDREKAEILSSILTQSSKVITSDLYKAETANVIYKYYKAKLISKEESFRTLKYCDSLIDEYIDISDNSEESLVESMRINHSTYDLLYFTIARRRGAILMTMDKKLNSLANENGIEIIK